MLFFLAFCLQKDSAANNVNNNNSFLELQITIFKGFLEDQVIQTIGVMMLYSFDIR